MCNTHPEKEAACELDDLILDSLLVDEPTELVYRK